MQPATRTRNWLDLHGTAITAGVAVAGVAVQLLPGLASWLQFDRPAILDGQWWRMLTGHLTHWSLEHLGWDLVMFVALGAIVEKLSRPRFVMLCLVSAISISLMVLLGQPELRTYRGLSGIDTALFVYLACDQLARAWQQRRWGQGLLPAVLLAGFGCKLLYEQLTGSGVFVNSQAADFAVVVMAHVVGATVGAVLGLALASSVVAGCSRRRSDCERPDLDPPKDARPVASEYDMVFPDLGGLLMMSRKELVDRAIAFDGPERVPVVFWNRDQTEGDLLLYHLSLGRDSRPDPAVNAWDWSVNEWGYKLESLGDGTMGHPVEPYYPELPAPGQFHAPPLREAERMAAVPQFVSGCEDRYRLASFDLSGFTVYTLLRGFENSMQDLLSDADGFAALLDLILGFECDLMRMAARHGFHGIHFADDWGTQTGLMVSPALWRRVFKPRFQRQFQLAHELGLHVWYHCCGNLTGLAGDFHEIGVDVLNISQPNVVDIAEVGRQLRGRQCFMMPISYQTVSIQGTREEILAEAQRLYDLLATPAGGFIGYVEEYSCMGMSEANYRACGEAFRRLG